MHIFFVWLLVVVMPFALAVADGYKGWGYVAERLIEQGVPRPEVQAVFTSRHMPHRPFVPFGIRSSEPTDIYKPFLAEKKLNKARQFFRMNKAVYERAARRYQVDPRVINAILYVETQFGEYTGRHPVVVRLARGASVGEEKNVRKNLKRLLQEGEETTYEALVERSKKVEAIFLPQLKALFEIGRKLGINIFHVKGSKAGAFGLPQFMPDSYLKFAVDGNGDGRVSLFQKEDAIHSVARYLAFFGWRNEASRSEKFDVLWNYNKSTPYCDTILAVAEKTA